MQIKYKISNVYIFSKEGNYISTPFVLSRNVKQNVILGTPFLETIKRYIVGENNDINYYNLYFAKLLILNYISMFSILI